VVSEADISAAATEGIQFTVGSYDPGAASVEVTITNVGTESIWVLGLGSPFIVRAESVGNGWELIRGSVPVQCITGSGFEELPPGESRSRDVWMIRNPSWVHWKGEPPPIPVTGRIRFVARFSDHAPHDGCAGDSKAYLFSDPIELNR
jgi:hypothetical protein